MLHEGEMETCSGTAVSRGCILLNFCAMAESSSRMENACYLNMERYSVI